MYLVTFLCIAAAGGSSTLWVAQDTAPKDPVAIYVNDHPIRQSEVDRMLFRFIEQQAQGRRPTPAAIESAREKAESEMINIVVDEYLLAEAFEKLGLKVDEAEYQRQTEIGLDRALAMMDTTREEYNRRMLETSGMSLDEVVKRKSADPTFTASVRVLKLLEKRYPKDMTISDEQIEKRYQSRKDRDYLRVAQVRASHILISTENLTTDLEKEEAYKKAKEVRAETQQEGADFAALARKYSTDANAPEGGDIGYFPRDGVMLEVLASAAFTMKVGDVSDVLRTPAGFEIIKVTGRKEEQALPLSRVKEWIRYELKGERIEGLRGAYVSELRAKADIHFPKTPG